MTYLGPILEHNIRVGRPHETKSSLSRIRCAIVFINEGKATFTRTFSRKSGDEKLRTNERITLFLL